MKKYKSLYFNFVCLILLSVMFVSCREENSEPEPVEPQLTLFIDEVFFGSDSGNNSFSFESNVECELRVVDESGSSTPWCTIRNESIIVIFGSGYWDCPIQVSANYGLKERNARIEFYQNGAMVASLKVYQCARVDEEYRDPVDLGLSVKWADVNIGAYNPADYGNYYAWGETEEKDWYSGSWANYKWCSGSEDTMTKYCTDSYWGKVDNKTTLDLEDDVAHVLWGDGWRMPTKDEFEELLSVCTWRPLSVNGVDGFRITGPNGNQIFLPLNNSLDRKYWSATLNNRNCSLAWGCAGPKYNQYSAARCDRFCIRPVKD